MKQPLCARLQDGKVTNYRIASPESLEGKARVNGETKSIRSEVNWQPTNRTETK